PLKGQSARPGPRPLVECTSVRSPAAPIRRDTAKRRRLYPLARCRLSAFPRLYSLRRKAESVAPFCPFPLSVPRPSEGDRAAECNRTGQARRGPCWFAAARSDAARRPETARAAPPISLWPPAPDSRRIGDGLP